MNEKKMKLTDALKTTTMFFNDEQTEASYQLYLDEQVHLLKNQLSDIGTLEGMQRYVRSNKNSLENLATLMGISVEKFKRVISWARLIKGYTFESEWTFPQLRTVMLENEQMMNEFSNLFIRGALLPEYTSVIPAFIIQDFRIDKEVINRLNSDDYLRNLVKAKITTEYNNKNCELYQQKLFEKIKQECCKIGVIFQNRQVPLLQENMDAICSKDKWIVVNSHYQLTTSSSQTSYYTDIVRPRYEKISRNDNYLMINILDGAGWVGRSSDYKKIYHDCHYFFNLNTVKDFGRILNEFLEV